MEIGTDANELFASIEPRKIEIEFNNKVWIFKVRDITWSEKNQIISQSAGISGGKKGKTTFDINKYNSLYLQKCVVDAPFEMTPTNILRLDEKFGDLLIEQIVTRLDRDVGETSEN